jgi:hypothetical protein
MPDGMYHTSDPDIEASTHQIRKQFHDTIRDIGYQGQQIENVEAFLISTNDMSKLHQLFHGSHNVPGGPSLDGQMSMYGVKIIESQYIPDGTIFKVCKNEPPMVYPDTQWGQAGSGVIPGWTFSKEQLEDNMLPMTTSVDTGKVTTKEIKENMEKAMKKMDEVMNEPIPSKGKRHSDKRRIELDD